MKKPLLFFSLFFILTSTALAQKDTVWVDSFKVDGVGILNSTIDSVREAGSISDVVFMLYPNERYVIDNTIVVQQGEELEIAAPKAGATQEKAPPQIVWREEVHDTQYMIHTYGDLTMKNIWVLYADRQGNQLQTGIVFEDQPGDKQEKGIFDGVIFDYAGIGPESGGSVTVKTDHFVGIFKNSYFRNNTDSHFQYYGRAVSFPFESTGWHYDSLLFENTTFANISRIVMMERDEYGDNIHLNHVTILNTIENVIQSGGYSGNSLGPLHKMSITNSIIVNPYLMGYRAIDVCDMGPEGTQDYDDFLNGKCNNPPGAIFNVFSVDSFDYEVDFTDLDRQIYLSHNSFVREDWYTNWLRNCPTCIDRIEVGEEELLRQPYPFISQTTLSFMDSTDANGAKVFSTMNIDTSSIYNIGPGFEEPATNLDSLKSYLYYKWDCGCQDLPWGYRTEVSRNYNWPLPEDMSYTNDTLLTAAMGGFPLGDLNWFPEQKAAWETQQVTEWENINLALEQGIIVHNETENPETPYRFNLSQNYPNPFNPTTVIRYQLPVSSQVSLKVYDLLGREVATLVNEQRAAGEHQVSFNAQNLSSGMFIYRLRTADFVQTKKMVVIK